MQPKYFLALVGLAVLSSVEACGQMFEQFAGNQAIENVVRQSTMPRLRNIQRPSMPITSSMTYSPNQQSLKLAESSYLDRLRKHDAQAADVLSQQMRAHDFGRVFSGIVGPFGLRRGDAVDSVTAYSLLGWMIATGSTDPTREQVRAMRERIAAGLAANPNFADPSTRAALGEELVISFVTLHAGWQSARREGKVQQYSDGVAAMFKKQTGNDLRQLVLTDRGLEKRG